MDITQALIAGERLISVNSLQAESERKNTA